MKLIRWSFYVTVSLLTILSLILQPVAAAIALPVRAPIAEHAASLDAKPVTEQGPAPTTVSETPTASTAISYTLHLPVVMRNYQLPAPIEAEIKPGEGGEIGSPEGDVRVAFSTKAITQTIIAAYSPAPAPVITTSKTGQVGQAFALAAHTLNGSPVVRFEPEVSVITHTSPITPGGVYHEYIVTPTLYLTMTYTAADVWGVDERALTIYTRDGQGAWTPLPTVVDVSAQVVRAPIEHFSEFALMAPAATTAGERVVLDPDHGGSDPGGYVDYPANFAAVEKTYTLEIAQLVRQKLESSCGLSVGMTRDADATVGHSDRPGIIMGFNPDLAVTLAFNTSGLAYMWYGDGGPMGLVDFSKPSDMDFATAMNASVATLGVSNHRGIRDARTWRGGIYVPTHLPNILYDQAELLFLDNYTDRAIMDDAAGKDSLAGAVYNEIISRLGLTSGNCQLQPPPSAEQIQKWRNLGYQNYQKYGADPVSFSTGNHVVQVPLVRIPGRGGLNFDFTLTYNAQDGRDGLFGYSWSMPYDTRLTLYRDQSIDVRHADGRTHHYTWNGSAYTAPAGVYDTLIKTANGWQLTTPAETVQTFIEVSPGQGRLAEWRDRQGNALHFAYANGSLSEIRDDANRTIQVQLNSDGRITALQLFDTRTLTFGYTDGNLTSITDPNSGTRRYEYDSRHRLTKERDAANILFLQNFYDDRDRVVEQIDASGAHDYLAYDPINRVTTFTDNGGNVTRYHYDEQNRITQVDNANSQATHDQYDANYNLIQHTDARGNTTQYAYDNRGNLLERRDPITTNDFYTTDVTHWTYNERNLVTSMTNAVGNTWTYEYDASGNLIKATAPDGSFTSATYNAWGQPASITDANGHTTTYVYDAYGNRVQTIDALGHTSSSTYDSSGRETSFTDANGHTVHFTYDGNGNIQQIRDPKNQLSTFNYDPNDLLTRSVDRRGAEKVYQYDDDLKLTGERNPLLRWQHYQYDALYRRASSTDALGRVTAYAYDALGQLIAVTDPLSQTTRYEYDANGNVNASIDPLGNRTRMIYDANNRLKFLIDAGDNRTEYCYDAEDRLVRTIGPRGEVTDYTYDKLNRLVAVKNPEGKVTHYEYDAVGNRTATITPLGYRTDTQYDALNRPVVIYQPVLPIGLRPITQYEYDAVGNTLAIINPRGFVTRFRYDANDNVIMQTDALNGLTQYVYDAEDHLTNLIDANGHAISTTFNLAGLPTATQDALGNSTTYTYDAANNLIQTLDALNHTTTFDYDALNRLVRSTDALSHTTQYTRDAVGRVTQLLDANAHTTDYAYDAVGRLIAVTDALSGTTQYAYDAAGNLTVITDANAHVTTFDYNLINQLQQETNPISNTWHYWYDADGHLTSRADAMWQATYYDYDSNGRLTQVHYGVTPPTLHPITFTYDLDGNETQMCDALGCTSNMYDQLDRRTTTVDWLGRTITRTYDVVGNPIGLTYPNGSEVAYQYDAANRLQTFIDPHGSASQYQRNALGQVTQIAHANGDRAQFAYDAANRLTGIDNRQLNAPQPQSAYAYMLDAVGNRVQVDEARAAFDGSTTVVTLTHAYQYDALNRLINAATAAPDTSTAYAFDAVGNRLSKSGSVLTPDAGVPALPVAPKQESVAYQYNAANQLTGFGEQGSSTALGYNPNGDRITQTQVLTDGTSLLTAYVYDRKDRLTNVTKSISDATAITMTMVATYTYDGYGRRALKYVTSYQFPITNSQSLITSTQVITYLYDGLDIIGAQLATSVITVSQAMTDVQVITPSWAITESYYYLAPSPITGLRRPVEMERLPNAETGFAGDRHWYQTDGLDSIEALTDDSGNLVSPLLYDEYGNQLAGSTDLQLFTYTAQDFDAETGLIHFYARYYDPQTGVWLTQDDWRGKSNVSASLHRYSYVLDSPINQTDVLGYGLQEWAMEQLYNSAKACYEAENWGCLWHDYWLLAKGGYALGYTNAANHMQRFLYKWGDIEYREREADWVKNASSTQNEIPKVKQSIEARIKDSLKDGNSSGHVETPKFRVVPNSQTEGDLYYAMNGFDLWGDGDYQTSYQITGKKYRVNVQVKYHFEDPYDWHGGLQAGGGVGGLGKFEDAWAKALHDKGYAQEYVVRGYWSDRMSLDIDIDAVMDDLPQSPSTDWRSMQASQRAKQVYGKSNPRPSSGKARVG